MKVVKSYRSLENVIRDVLTEKKNMESDQNDQVTAGTYTTKSFEVSPAAQKLYADLPVTIDATQAELAVINLDKLFDIEKQVTASDKKTDAMLAAANTAIEKIRYAAQAMGLEKEHDAFIKKSMSVIDGGSIEPEEVDADAHPSDMAVFNSPPAGNKPDPAKVNAQGPGDRDIDNIKRYLIRRSKKAQRKIKIIDAE
jgi:hypothetical protein